MANGNVSDGKDESQFAITLEGFRFPKALGDNKSNFHFTVGLRFFDKDGNFNTVHTMLPGLDTYWECDPKNKGKANYVRDPVGNRYVSFDMDAVGKGPAQGTLLNYWNNLDRRFLNSDYSTNSPAHVIPVIQQRPLFFPISAGPKGEARGPAAPPQVVRTRENPRPVTVFLKRPNHDGEGSAL